MVPRFDDWVIERGVGSEPLHHREMVIMRWGTERGVSCDRQPLNHCEMAIVRRNVERGAPTAVGERRRRPELLCEVDR